MELFTVICAEEKCVPLDKVNTHRTNQIKTVTVNYKLNNIFNSGETSIF